MPSYTTTPSFPASAGRRDADIQLPNTSGKVDPRIKRKTPDPIAGLKKAGQHLQMLREKGLFKRKAD